MSFLITGMLSSVLRSSTNSFLLLVLRAVVCCEGKAFHFPEGPYIEYNTGENSVKVRLIHGERHALFLSGWMCAPEIVA